MHFSAVPAHSSRSSSQNFNNSIRQDTLMFRVKYVGFERERRRRQRRDALAPLAAASQPSAATDIVDDLATRIFIFSFHFEYVMNGTCHCKIMTGPTRSGATRTCNVINNGSLSRWWPSTANFQSLMIMMTLFQVCLCFQPVYSKKKKQVDFPLNWN